MSRWAQFFRLQATNMALSCSPEENNMTAFAEKGEKGILHFVVTGDPGREETDEGLGHQFCAGLMDVCQLPFGIFSRQHYFVLPRLSVGSPPPPPPAPGPGSWKYFAGWENVIDCSCKQCQSLVCWILKKNSLTIVLDFKMFLKVFI